MTTALDATDWIEGTHANIRPEDDVALTRPLSRISELGDDTARRKVWALEMLPDTDITEMELVLNSIPQAEVRQAVAKRVNGRTSESASAEVTRGRARRIPQTEDYTLDIGTVGSPLSVAVGLGATGLGLAFWVYDVALDDELLEINTDLVPFTGGVNGIALLLPEAGKVEGRIFAAKRLTGGTLPINLLPRDGETVDGSLIKGFPSGNAPIQFELLEFQAAGAGWRVTKYYNPTAPLTLTSGITDLESPYTTDWAVAQLVAGDCSSGDITVNLQPAATLANRFVYIKRQDATPNDANTLTIDGHGAETIDGSPTYALEDLESVILYSDGTEWTLISRFDPRSYLELSGGTLTGPLLLPDGTAADPALAFASDTGVGIYRQGADTGALVSGGSELLIWDDNGVGMGASPRNAGWSLNIGERLNIQDGTKGVTLGSFGYGAFGSTLSSGGYISIAGHSAWSGVYLKAGGATQVEVNGSETIFSPGGTEIARFDATGLGIGTSSSPAADLEIKSRVANQTFVQLTSSVGQALFKFVETAANEPKWELRDSANTKLVELSVGSGAATLGILSTLGVGTLAPGSGYRLWLEGSSFTGTALGFANNVPDGDFAWGFDYTGSSVQGFRISGGNAILSMRDETDTQTVLLSTASDSYLTGGDFGIGTSSPGAQLEIGGTLDLLFSDTGTASISSGGLSRSLTLNAGSSSSGVMTFKAASAVFERSGVSALTGVLINGATTTGVAPGYLLDVIGASSARCFAVDGALQTVGIDAAPTASSKLTIGVDTLDAIVVQLNTAANKWGLKFTTTNQTSGSGLATLGATGAGSQLLLREGSTAAVRLYSATSACYINNGVGLVLGGTTLMAGTLFDVQSTTAASSPWPKMTTTQRNTMATSWGSSEESATIYNTTTQKVETWDGSAWNAHW